jgi:hypothetical protein
MICKLICSGQEKNDETKQLFELIDPVIQTSVFERILYWKNHMIRQSEVFTPPLSTLTHSLAFYLYSFYLPNRKDDMLDQEK